MNTENILESLLWLTWIIISISILRFSFRRSKKSEKAFDKSLWLSTGITFLITPSLVGTYTMPIPIPASIGVYGHILSLIFGDIWAFRSNSAFEGIIFSLMCLCIFFPIITFIVYLYVNKKHTQTKAQQNNGE